MSIAQPSQREQDKLLTPIKTHRLGPMLPGRLDRIGLDLVPAAPAPMINRS
jgi:hypothetical protein